MRYCVVAFCLGLLFPLSGRSQQSASHLPEKINGGRYLLRAGLQEIEIDPAIGGRIVALRLNGNNFLTGSEVNDFNWGSTLWPSPQSEWNWPPPAVLDNRPYTTTVERNELIMVSAIDPQTGLSFIKKFSANARQNGFTLKYSIVNHNDTARKAAPWEVTRVRPNGLAFFPAGKGGIRGGLVPMTFLQDGIYWFAYQSDKLPGKGDSQIYADGSEGWFAQVNDGLMLLKMFKDAPLDKNAPAEGEVELYANKTTPEKSYVEVEHQGPYETLAPGASTTWTMAWRLGKIPDGVKQEAGNKELVNFARNWVKNKK